MRGAKYRITYSIAACALSATLRCSGEGYARACMYTSSVRSRATTMSTMWPGTEYRAKYSSG